MAVVYLFEQLPGWVKNLEIFRYMYNIIKDGN